MVNQYAVAERAHPAVRIIGMSDVWDALAEGVDDFLAMPSHAVFLCIIYPIVGLVLGRLVFGLEILPMLFPLAAGFALLGPFAAVGLYELSRRRELGIERSAWDALRVLKSSAGIPIAELGGMMLLIFVTWLVAAQAIYAMTFGGQSPASISQFVQDVFTTERGWALIVIGNGVGLLFAIAAFSLSVVSFQMALDCGASAPEAAATSIRVVADNPKTMAAWGIIVAAALVIGMLPFFIGLIVVLPVLGHASWHLYRKLIPR